MGSWRRDLLGCYALYDALAIGLDDLTNKAHPDADAAGRFVGLQLAGESLPDKGMPHPMTTFTPDAAHQLFLKR
jgi:hypothetical protein